MTRMRTNVLPFLLLVGGCLFTGEETRGLPCNVDAECGVDLSCLDRICGGPMDMFGSTDTDTGTDGPSSDEESGEPDDGGLQPELCSVSECKNDDTIRLCLDDGKVSTIGCQGLCGASADSLGCHYNPADDEDGCFCDFERPSCSTEGAQACFGQGGLALCQGATWSMYDCDTVCVDAGYAGASGCGAGDGGADVCLCDNVCTHGASRCTGSQRISYCANGSWQQYDCNQLCIESGFSTALACTFFPDPGDDSCACI